MTHQEAFNQVWGWFVLDRHEPGTFYGHCVYYNRDTGNRCAIGCLLPVSLLQDLRPLHMRLPVEGLRTDYLEVAEILRGCGPKFLNDLQDAHDDSASGATLLAATAAPGPRPGFHALIERRLRLVAHRWHLTVPEAAGEEGEECLAAIEGATAPAAVLRGV